MKISNAIAKIVKYAGDHSVTLCFKSRPGQGKSSMVFQAAEQLNVPVIEVRAGLIDDIKLTGLPSFSGDSRHTQWTIPDWLPREERDGPQGILFIDELGQANQQIQNLLSQLILDKHIDDYYLPKNWSIVCATNRMEDRAGTFKMPTHIANRLTHIEIDFSLDDWVSWAHKHNLYQGLIAFAKFRPELLEKFDPNQEINCTPRTLAMCNAYIGDEDLHELVSGLVGEGVAAELTGFLRVWDEMPDIDALLKSPSSAKVPDKPDVRFAVTQALSFRLNPDNADRADLYMTKLPKEFRVSCWKDALRRDPTLTSTPAFKAFLKENSALLV